MKELMRILLCLTLAAGIGQQSKCSGSNDAPAVVADTAKTDSLIHFTISSVGDLMCHSTQYNYARVEADSFNFVPCFKFIQPYLDASDLLLGNLETTLSGTEIPYSGYPFFNSPDDYAESIKKVGFDFIITANNHANDHGENGIVRTIGILDKLQLPHTGTFASSADRDSARVVNVKGVKIGIVAYSYSTNGNPLAEGKPWLVNLCDSVLIEKDIKNCRANGADLVIVFYHFGNEYQRQPSEYQENFVQYAISCGADIIFGSHPHVLEPAAYFTPQHAAIDTGFVIYSMGNFISNQKDEFTDEGIVVNLHLTKNNITGKIQLNGADYIPTWVYRGTSPEMQLHTVFPAVAAPVVPVPELIQKSYASEMKKAAENTYEIMHTFTNDFLPAEK